MGSFNTACGITHQVISPNMDCVIIPIIQSTSNETYKLKVSNKRRKEFTPYFNSKRFAHNCLWKPFSMYLECIYDDYGLFILKDTQYNIKAAHQLFDLILNSEFIYNDECNPVDFSDWYSKFAIYTINELNDIFLKVQDYKVFIGGNDDNVDTSPLSFTPLLKESFETVINYSSSVVRWDNKTFDKEILFTSWFNQQLEKSLSQIKTAYKFNLDEISANDECKINHALYIFLIFNILNFHEYEAKPASDKSLNLVEYTSDELSLVIDLFENMNINIRSKSYDFCEIITVYEYLEPNLNMLHFNFMMCHLNLKYTPWIYIPQDYSNDTGNEYLKLVGEINAAVNKKNRE